MKLLLTILIIILAFTIMSCKWYTVRRFQINKPFSFLQKSEFINQLKKKKAFNINQVLYVEKESYEKFLRQKITQDSTVFYVGTYFKDSMIVKRSQHLNENTSCIGRIEQEIRNDCSRNHFNENELMTVSKMSGYNLKYLCDNKTFDINADEKAIKIFLTYSTRYGKWYDGLYKEINGLQKKNNQNVSVYVVCLDPIYKLP